MHIARFDIGRVGHHEVETARKCRAEVAANKPRARGEPEPLGIAACDGQRLHAHVNADTQRIRHLRKERQQQRAGAGAAGPGCARALERGA